MARTVTVWLMGGWVLAQSLATAQDRPEIDPMKVSELVFELQQQLDDQSIPVRDAAEKQIVSLGIEALNHLPPIDDSLTADLRERMLRIRTALEKQAVVAVTHPSRVELKGKFTLQELLAEIKRQTGNELLLADSVPLDQGQRQVTRDHPQRPFWEVLDELLAEFHLEIDALGGRLNTLQLMPVRSPPADESLRSKCDAGILRLEVTRIDSTRGLIDPAMNQTSYTLQVRWEPRLRPIAIDIPLKSLVVTDEFDHTYTAPSEGILYGIVQPEIPELEYTLPLPLVDRQVELLTSITGMAQAVLPGRIETFEFLDVARLTEETTQLKAGATVTYRGMVKNEDLFGARISLSFDEEHNALESHQGWAYQNEAYLLTSDQRRIDFIATETFQQTNHELGVMYLFPEFPEGARLVYRTPAAIVKLEIPFELKKIKLP